MAGRAFLWVRRVLVRLLAEADIPRIQRRQSVREISVRERLDDLLPRAPSRFTPISRSRAVLQRGMPLARHQSRPAPHRRAGIDRRHDLPEVLSCRDGRGRHVAPLDRHTALADQLREHRVLRMAHDLPPLRCRTQSRSGLTLTSSPDSRADIREAIQSR